MSKLEDSDRYYNWYHGYTGIKLPYYRYGKFNYYVDTSATSGTITTQSFGEKFDVDKVETELLISVSVYPPASVKNNKNVTLHFEVEKLSLTDLSSGEDKLRVGSVNVDTTHGSYNYTAQESDLYAIYLQRKVLPVDVRKQQLNLMPGFKITWHYSGMEVEPEAKYLNGHNLYKSTKAFIRNGSKNFL